jgi:hypothetical protein
MYSSRVEPSRPVVYIFHEIEERLGRQEEGRVNRRVEDGLRKGFEPVFRKRSKSVPIILRKER